MSKKNYPYQLKRDFIAAVVRRTGICRATCEQVVPAVFDEIRYQLTEGSHCVPVESFGTFAVVDIPERVYHYTYKGYDEDRIVPPKKRMKFAPTRSFRRELDAQRFDTTRRSFSHHPADPHIRRLKDLSYRPNQEGFHRSKPQGQKKE